MFEFFVFFLWYSLTWPTMPNLTVVTAAGIVVCRLSSERKIAPNIVPVFISSEFVRIHERYEERDKDVLLWRRGKSQLPSQENKDIHKEIPGPCAITINHIHD
jgi:hypothetical protein